MKEKKNILQQTGFKVPDNYFEDFKVDFSRKEVNNSSTLESIKSSGFKTPENYLDNFEVNLSSISKKPSKVITLNQKKIINFISVAAAVAVLLIIIFKEPTVNYSEENLSPLAIEDYIEQNEFDFENEINYESLSNFNNIHVQLNTVDNDAILEYLSNNTDIAALLDE